MRQKDSMDGRTPDVQSADDPADTDGTTHASTPHTPITWYRSASGFLIIGR